jgi:four helix bundle protein
MGYKSFEEMPVWQKAMELAVRIFNLTEKLPRKEDYSLTSQIRKSSLSVSGNIAEGFGRKHTKDKLNFYYHSRGSLAETKSHLIYGREVGYFDKKEFEDLSRFIDEIWKELNSLINSLTEKAQP